VQSFIYQFVVLNKINRLTLKRFEQNIPAVTFEVVNL